MGDVWEVRVRVTFEWMEGGFYFIIQHVDLEQYGQRIKGIELIGHDKPFGSEPSEEIKSRFYSNTGDTIDYVYELEETLSPSGEEYSGVCQERIERGRKHKFWGVGVSGWWRISVHYDQDQLGETA